jgi:hypothetical protein
MTPSSAARRQHPRGNGEREVHVHETDPRYSEDLEPIWGAWGILVGAVGGVGNLANPRHPVND